MSIRNLSHLFSPASVAVIGASNRQHSVGTTVLNNLLAGGYAGTVFPVNPKYETLAGLAVAASVEQLAEAPDLALICTPAHTVPGLIEALGRRGTKAAIVLSAGLGSTVDADGVSMRERMLQAARPHLLRILGPNCVGLLVPGIGLNASFAHVNAKPGKIAFVSQSGAMVTGVLDWAKSRGIGFSKFISLGDGADVDFGDVLDYLANDRDTESILLYIEAITSVRKFMSAARAAARSKPTIVIKAGRVEEGARAAASHTGAMAGSDEVYDAAIRRAGMLRVYATEDLFDAVETLARARPLRGERLAILTNGGGPGVMATDTLIDEGGQLATLSAATVQALNDALPPNWSHGNPVDIIGDAPTERYVRTLNALLCDPAVDATLLIHAPTAIVPSAEIAAALVPEIKYGDASVLACWLGGESVATARHAFEDAGIPAYDTPEKAVNGFMQMVRYRRNQELLMQVPASVPATLAEQRMQAKSLVAQALTAGRDMLSEPEAKTVLKAYGIPVVETRVVASAEEALQAARELGYPVALKLLSPDVVHKSDIGGVALDIDDEAALQSAAAAMQARLRQLRPNAVFLGFTVQTMVRRPHARELILGVATDPLFGPVILFGHGGVAVEVTNDHAIGLPPLNVHLARDMVGRTRIAKLLCGYRNRLPADVEAVYRTLVQVSDMVVDIPELAELDINPLIADAAGVIALDARIRVARPKSVLQKTSAPEGRAGINRLAIRPYPAELEERISWLGEAIVLRPIQPEDSAAHLAFFQALEQDDIHARALGQISELSPSAVARFTQIDYDREMAFIASRELASGEQQTLGVARAVTDPDNINVEFAIIVRSDLKASGLGTHLLKKLVAYCRSRGSHRMLGETLPENARMLALGRRCGFAVERHADRPTVTLRLELAAQDGPASVA